MPTAQVELDHGDEAFERIIDGGHRQKGLRMSHEASDNVMLVLSNTTVIDVYSTYLVIRSNIDRGSKMKVGSTTRLRSAPGRSWLIMCDRTERSAS